MYIYVCIRICLISTYVLFLIQINAFSPEYLAKNVMLACEGGAGQAALRHVPREDLQLRPGKRPSSQGCDADAAGQRGAPIATPEDDSPPPPRTPVTR